MICINGYSINNMDKMTKLLYQPIVRVKMNKNIVIKKKRKSHDSYSSSSSSCTDSFDSCDSSDDSDILSSTESTDSRNKNIQIRRASHDMTNENKNSPNRNSPNRNVDTETKVNGILKKLDYNNLTAVQAMLDVTIKKLDEREKELIFYKKRCLAYEKAIETLQNEIKMLKTFEKK